MTYHMMMKTSNHTGSVTSRVKKDRAFRRTPGRRCQVCYCSIIEDSLKRHHQKHIKRKDTKSCLETSGTNTKKMNRCRWNIIEFCEMRWKKFCETTAEEGHKVFFRGKEDKHDHGGGSLVHKDIANTVTECRPVSSRLITIRLRSVPFNITIIQAHTQTSDYDDNETEELYDQLQCVIDQTPKKKKDILVAQRRLECKSG